MCLSECLSFAAKSFDSVVQILHDERSDIQDGFVMQIRNPPPQGRLSALKVDRELKDGELKLVVVMRTGPTVTSKATQGQTTLQAYGFTDKELKFGMEIYMDPRIISQGTPHI